MTTFTLYGQTITDAALESELKQSSDVRAVSQVYAAIQSDRVIEVCTATEKTGKVDTKGNDKTKLVNWYLQEVRDEHGDLYYYALMFSQDGKDSDGRKIQEMIESVRLYPDSAIGFNVEIVMQRQSVVWALTQALTLKWAIESCRINSVSPEFPYCVFLFGNAVQSQLTSIRQLVTLKPVTPDCIYAAHELLSKLIPEHAHLFVD